MRIEGDIAYVTLTRGLEAIIDATDAEEIGRWNWKVHFSGNTAYATRKDSLLNAPRPGYRRNLWMHRVVLGVDQMVDHIDMNGLNNRRSNLRVATDSQNKANRNVRPDSATGFRGVYVNKKRFMARITLGENRHYLGTFDTPEEASEAYKAAAVRLFGEFTRL